MSESANHSVLNGPDLTSARIDTVSKVLGVIEKEKEADRWNRSKNIYEAIAGYADHGVTLTLGAIGGGAVAGLAVAAGLLAPAILPLIVSASTIAGIGFLGSAATAVFALHNEKSAERNQIAAENSIRETARENPDVAQVMINKHSEAIGLIKADAEEKSRRLGLHGFKMVAVGVTVAIAMPFIAPTLAGTVASVLGVVLAATGYIRKRESVMAFENGEEKVAEREVKRARYMNPAPSM